MSNKSIKPVASAIGAAIAGSMMLAGAAGAADNPFGMTELNSGYMQIAAAEGKCGGNMKVEKKADGKCGTGKCGGNMQAKPMEGKCGGNMQAKPMEGKCGGNMKVEKKVDGKCGTGKCGGNMKMQPKAMEGKCGGSK